MDGSVGEVERAHFLRQSVNKGGRGCPNSLFSLPVVPPVDCCCLSFRFYDVGGV